MDVFRWMEIGAIVLACYALAGLGIWIDTLEAREVERKRDEERRNAFINGQFADRDKLLESLARQLLNHDDRLNRIEAVVLRGREPGREVTGASTSQKRI